MGWEGYGENQTRGIKLEKDVTVALYIYMYNIEWFLPIKMIDKKRVHTFDPTKYRRNPYDRN